MSAGPVPAVLQEVLAELGTESASPGLIPLFDALYLLCEALKEGRPATTELDELQRVHQRRPDERALRVLLALGQAPTDHPPDPLEPVLQAAGLPRETPEPHKALEAYIRRQEEVRRVLAERLAQAESILRRSSQLTHAATAAAVVLLGVVALLLLVEGGFLDLPEPVDTQEEVEPPPPPTPQRRPRR